MPGVPVEVGLEVHDESLAAVTVSYLDGAEEISVPAAPLGADRWAVTIGDLCRRPGGVTLAVVATDIAGNELRQEFTPGIACDAASHFMCYRTKITAGSPAFVPVPGVALGDGLGSGRFDVERPLGLCAPAESDGAGLTDPDTHLEAYRIKASAGEAPPVPRRGVTVIDRFGALTLDAIKPERLLLPTAKGLDAPAGAPAGELDDFKCYKVKRSKGAPRFARGRRVVVADQFESRSYDLIKPTRLCAPVSRDGGPVASPEAHLMCYRAKPAKGEPRHTPVVDRIHTNNDFGSGRLDTVREDELCVPAATGP